MFAQQALGQREQSLAGLGQDKRLGSVRPLRFEAGSLRGIPYRADGRVGSNNELAGAVFGRANAWAASGPSSLKLVACAEIHIWRTGVFGVTTNLLEPFSKMMFMTPLLSSNSKPPDPSSAAIIACFRVSRAVSDSRRNLASSSMGLV